VFSRNWGVLTPLKLNGLQRRGGFDLLKYLTTETEESCIPITPVRKADWETWLSGQPEAIKRWVDSTTFRAEAGTFSLIANREGVLERVLLGVGDEDGLWDWAGLPERLPERTYTIDRELDTEQSNRIALGWALGTYSYQQYKEKEGTTATLVWPKGCDPGRVERAATATFFVRDLINTPASDMGPGELADAARKVAEENDAACRVILGEDLLKENYPAVHAVGRASEREPRLIDIQWGEESAKKVTLVGKGVCFDSGGLDIKPAANMKLMKKDMGGAAHVLGLARMIMEAKLLVRLRVLVPAVENAVSGSALRPLDVVPTRKGLTVEIGHTDAEGRVILSDALAEAAGEKPELIVDFATLTGAARVALGTELPAVFSNDDDVAEALFRHGLAEDDPLWRMPLWKPYRKQIDSKVANLTNSTVSPYAGSITAALFLAEFVEEVPWVHVDLMAWNTETKPGRPEGGEAQGMRTVFAFLEERFA
jgi:leucyl aminopeptidase